MDISKLTAEQKEYAYQVAQEAIKQGVNPDFVLPMVMQESGFDPKAESKKGAYGLMQLLPTTAKDLGVDHTDVEQNIRGGITLIKNLMQNPVIGSNPYKVLAAYHSGEAGADTFLKSGDINDLGPNAKQHLYDVSQKYGKELPNVLSGESVEQEGTPAADTKSGTPSFEAKKLASSDTADAIAANQVHPIVGGIIGGAAGALVGGQAAYAKAHVDAATEALNLFNKKFNPVVDVPVTTQTVPSKAPAAAAITPTTTTATTPKTGGQNWVKSLTDVDLPNGQMSKADLDLAKNMQKSIGTAGEKGFTGGKITPGGIIINPQDAATIKVKTEAAQKLANDAKLMREAQKRIALQNAENSRIANEAMLAREEAAAAQSLIKPSASRFAPIYEYGKKLLSYPVKGALIGGGLGLGSVDAYNRYRTGDTLGSGLSAGATAVGAAVPMLAPLAAAGMALYDDPEKRKRFVEAMQPGGAWQERMDTRFGLD